MTPSRTRTLLSHEWIAPTGGSENVFEQMTRALPEAGQVCLWNDDPKRFPSSRETWLAKTPLRRSKAAALPFMWAALRSVDLSAYDRLVSSSHAFGHYLATRGAQMGMDAYAYVHSPARYIWAPDHDDRGQALPVRTLARGIRRIDRRTASAQVRYAANSSFVRDRISRCWRVDSTVIHPPVRVGPIALAFSRALSPEENALIEALPDNFVLGASRLVPYKRLDLVIKLGSSLDLPVVIAGDGPDRERLKARAESVSIPTYFVGRVSDRVLFELYRRSSLYAFLPVEDFGIMPLEAIAAGASVVVNVEGGAWEGVATTGAGERCQIDDWTSVLEAAQLAIQLKQFSGPKAVATHSEEQFRKRFRAWIGESSDYVL